MMFRFRANDKMIGLTAFVLWIISLIFLISMAAFEGWHFNEYGRISKTYELEHFNSDTLSIIMEADPDIDNFSTHSFDINDPDWHILSTMDKVYGKIDLNIQPGSFQEWEMAVRKNSQGRNDVEATANAAKLNYGWKQKSSSLILDPYFSLDKPNRWRAPGTTVTLMVPEGKFIWLDKNTRYFLNRVKTQDELRKQEIAGKVWKMTENGLVPAI